MTPDEATKLVNDLDVEGFINLTKACQQRFQFTAKELELLSAGHNRKAAASIRNRLEIK